MKKYIFYEIFFLSLIILVINILYLFGFVTIFFQYTIGFWYGLVFSYFLKKESTVLFSYILFGLLSQIIYLIYIFFMSNNFDLFLVTRRLIISGITALLFGVLVSKFYTIRFISKDYIFLFFIGVLSTSLLIPAKSNSLILNTKEVLFLGKYTLWFCAFLWQLGVGWFLVKIIKIREK